METKRVDSDDDEIIRIELRIKKSKVDGYKTYQIKNQIEGTLQKSLEIMLDRELSCFRLIDQDKELVKKVSFCKTITHLYNMIHTMTPDNLTVRELKALKHACEFLIDFGNYVHPPIIDETEQILEPGKY